MIGFLSGTCIHAEEGSVSIEVHGIGYEVQCPKSVIGEIAVGKSTSLWIHTHVREDAITLYGFLNKSERSFFLSLLKVAGVGPKMALGILSSSGPQELASAIENGDVSALSRLPKVGKKTAEQMILTLKGKLVLEGTPDRSSRTSEIRSALSNLGFSDSEIRDVIPRLTDEMDLMAAIRKGLSLMSRSRNEASDATI